MALVVSGAAPAAAAPAATSSSDWQQWVSLPGVVDVVGPRPDGMLVAAAAGKLFTVDPATGTTTPFSTYSTDPAPESYIAMSPGLDVPAGPTCRFEAGDVFALELSTPPLGIVQVTVDGQSGRFVDLPGAETLTGIAFDTTGRFGNKLLVAGRKDNKTVLFAIDCRGRVVTLTDSAPVIEGGMQMAPQTFGSHGGDLIGVDENTGDVVFIRYDGTSGVLISSGLPTGGDVGVESLGFVPTDFINRGGTAYMTDRKSPGAPTEGTDNIWRLNRDALSRVGIDDDDLIVSTEGGGRTVIVRCRETCRILQLGQAPNAHVEGHITVVLGPPLPPWGGYLRTGSIMFGVSTLVLIVGGFILYFVHRKRSPNFREPDPA
ncbi:MAG TPA: hypothetical protein VHT97_11220 [Acidimicrobiales bacterium]|nr:hypothetical protein [Acidimicrobiales bacterium]